MSPTRCIILAGLLTITAPIAVRADEAGIEFFEKRIRPVFVEHCYECHSQDADDPEAGLLLDSVAGIQKGGASGEIISDGDVSGSPLYEAVSYSGSVSEMPPDGKLPERVIADIRRWIEMGAPLPAGGEVTDPSPQERVDIEGGRDFWSFRPVRELPTPDVDSDRPQRKIDHFVLRALERRGLAPSPEADRRTLIRRASFDLIGLPPDATDVESFVQDPSTGAWEDLVERLLASPHYGERWGRHWLDVARYAEDNPTSEQTCKPPRFPWHYRDWVIQALNDDLPYDEFVRRQLAADLMDDLAPSEVAATGFLGLSPVYHKEPKLAADVISVIVADEWDERLDTITRGFLGLTVACARCHDHKFDPITTHDYYALAGVLASTQLVEWPLADVPERQAEIITETREAIVDLELRISYAKEMRDTARMKEEDAAPFEQRLAELEPQLEELKNRNLFDGPIANAVRDAATWVNGDDPDWTTIAYDPGTSRDLPVFLRGNPNNPGEIVARRFLEVLSDGEPQPFGYGSGRQELAECIVGEAASLAARVIVNRVWGWHFGQPLVRTPSNLGRLGEPPSHPELLDDLAARFIGHGWSLKWLHREIMLSATYCQSSAVAPEQAAAVEQDPDNRLLWRMNRLRLEPEVWRDTVLSVAGRLDLSSGGPSKELDDEANRRRTIYGSVSRQQPADILRLFDFPDAKFHNDRRILTTTPLQQLYLLNSAWLQQQAEALAESVLQETGGDAAEAIIQRIFSRILQREASEQETDWSIALVMNDDAGDNVDWSLLAHALLVSNEFLYVD